jgi:hypothetical protein
LLSLVESSRELPAWGSRGHSIERVVPFSPVQRRDFAYLYTARANPSEESFRRRPALGNL